MQQKTSSPHARGWRIYTGKFPQVLALLGFQVLLRLLAFAPLLYALVTQRFPGAPRDMAAGLGLLASLPLYAVIVMPFRFQAAARKAQLSGLERNSRISLQNYWRWLPAALLRLLHALPFLLPFFVFAALYYYYMPYPDLTVPMLGIANLGKLVGGEILEGILIIVSSGILTAILAAYGWQRGLAFEHQAVLEQGIRKSLAKARALRRRRRRVIARTHFINLLLCLPAVAGVLYAIASFLLSIPRVGMLVMDYLNYATYLLKLKIPGSTVQLIGILLALLWLPILPWRKLALSAALLERAPQGGE